MSRIYIKTSKGAQSLLEGSIGLEERHVSVLKLIDGIRGSIDISGIALIPEPEVAEILQKLFLIGYARAIGSSPPTAPLDISAPGRLSLDATSDAIESVSRFDPLDARPVLIDDPDFDLAALLQSAKTRTKAIPSAVSLGSAHDVWHETQAMAHQAMAERLEQARLARETAERALEQVRARDAEIELERRRKEEASERERVDSEARAKASAEFERARQEALEIEQAKNRRLGVHKKRFRILASLALCLAFAGEALRVHSMLTLTPESCGTLLSYWSQSKSSVKSCGARFFPLPRFEAEGIEIGDLHVASARGDLYPLALFADIMEPSSLTLSGVSMDASALGVLLRRPKLAKASRLRDVEVEDSRVLLGSYVLDHLQGRAHFDASGQAQSVALDTEDRLARIVLLLDKGVINASIQAHFPDPGAAPIPGMIDFTTDGPLLQDGFIMERGALTHKSGTVRFSGEAYWTGGPWSLKTKFDARSFSAQDLSPWLFNSGHADLIGTFLAEGPTLSAALLAARVDATAAFRDVSFKLDLPETLGVGGSIGQSAFINVKAKASFSGKSQSYSFPALSSGPLRASIDAKISEEGAVSGLASVSIPDRSMRSDNILGGTARSITLKAR